MSELAAAVPLLRCYDAGQMTAEARALRDIHWRAQRAYGQDGIFREASIDWRILPLRSPGATRTAPTPAARASKNTPTLPTSAKPPTSRRSWPVFPRRFGVSA